MVREIELLIDNIAVTKEIVNDESPAGILYGHTFRESEREKEVIKIHIKDSTDLIDINIQVNDSGIDAFKIIRDLFPNVENWKNFGLED